MVDENQEEKIEIDPELEQIIFNSFNKQFKKETKIYWTIILVILALMYFLKSDFIKTLSAQIYIDTTVSIISFFVFLFFVGIGIVCLYFLENHFKFNNIVIDENGTVIENLKIIQVNNIDENETILWQEDGSYPEKQEKYSSESMSPKEQIIALVAILPFVLGVAWLCLLEVYQQWIILLIYSIAGVICLGIVVAIFYLIKNELKKQIPNLEIGHIGYSYVITDKAVYVKNGKVDKPFDKFCFKDIDTIYTNTSNTSICIGRYKDCDEEDMSLENVKDFDTALNLLKEKTGIKPKVY